MVVAITGILSTNAVFADIKSPKKGHDTSNTNTEQHSNQSIVASGLT